MYFDFHIWHLYILMIHTWHYFWFSAHKKHKMLIQHRSACAAWPSQQDLEHHLETFRWVSMQGKTISKNEFSMSHVTYVYISFVTLYNRWFPRFLARQSVQLVDQRLRNRNKKALQICEALFLFSSFNWNFYKNKQKEPQLKNIRLRNVFLASLSLSNMECYVS